jgi:hypothetical protein
MAAALAAAGAIEDTHARGVALDVCSLQEYHALLASAGAV